MWNHLADTEVEDTEVEDTEVEDMEVEDTEVEDTEVEDTEVGDDGGGVDTDTATAQDQCLIIDGIILGTGTTDAKMVALV